MPPMAFSTLTSPRTFWPCSAFSSPSCLRLAGITSLRDSFRSFCKLVEVFRVPTYEKGAGRSYFAETLSKLLSSVCDSGTALRERDVMEGEGWWG